jgi:hypothetical protein
MFLNVRQKLDGDYNDHWNYLHAVWSLRHRGLPDDEQQTIADKAKRALGDDDGSLVTAIVAMHRAECGLWYDVDERMHNLIPKLKKYGEGRRDADHRLIREYDDRFGRDSPKESRAPTSNKKKVITFGFDERCGDAQMERFIVYAVVRLVLTFDLPTDDWTLSERAVREEVMMVLGDDDGLLVAALKAMWRADPTFMRYVNRKMYRACGLYEERDELVWQYHDVFPNTYAFYESV